MLFDRLGREWASLKQELTHLRALLVDDDDIVCAVVTELLEGDGFAVQTATSAEDAWERLQKEAFDILVTDKNLPGRSGLELIGQAKQARIDVPAVMITGYASIPSVAEAFDKGAVDYIAKPFDDINQVGRRLKSVAEQHVAARLYRRIIADLKNAMLSTGPDRTALENLAAEIGAYKAQLGERPSLVVVDPVPSRIATVVEALERGKTKVEIAAKPETALDRLGDSDGPLAAIVSLDVPNPATYIFEMRTAEPLTEIIALCDRATLSAVLGAVDAGATDVFDISIEGAAVLRARASRLMQLARSRRLHVFLIGALCRRVAVHDASVAEALRSVLPPEQRRYIDEAPRDLAAPAMAVDLSTAFTTDDEPSSTTPPVPVAAVGAVADAPPAPVPAPAAAMPDAAPPPPTTAATAPDTTAPAPAPAAAVPHTAPPVPATAAATPDTATAASATATAAPPAPATAAVVPDTTPAAPAAAAAVPDTTIAAPIVTMATSSAATAGASPPPQPAAAPVLPTTAPGGRGPTAATGADLAHLSRLADLGQMVAGLVHELRQPLLAIKADAQLIMHGTNAALTAEERMQRVIGYTQRMETLLDQVLTYARGETPNRLSSSCSLNDVATAACELARLGTASHTQVEVATTPHLPAVLGDALGLQQVFINLIVNASQAIGARPGHIVVRTRRDDDFVEADVEDDGPGVAPEQRERIFEPFLTTKEKGTGLGLSISRQIVESAGGSLDLVPTDRGACFRVRLPAAPTG